MRSSNEHSSRPTSLAGSASEWIAFSSAEGWDEGDSLAVRLSHRLTRLVVTVVSSACDGAMPLGELCISRASDRSLEPESSNLMTSAARPRAGYGSIEGEGTGTAPEAHVCRIVVRLLPCQCQIHLAEVSWTGPECVAIIRPLGWGLGRGAAR